MPESVYCRRCLGSGTITVFTSVPRPDQGGAQIVEVRQTCPTCGGSGRTDQ